MMQDRTLTIQSVSFFLEPGGAASALSTITLNERLDPPTQFTPTSFNDSNLKLAEFTDLGGKIEAGSDKPWTAEIKIDHAGVNLRNMYMLVQYLV